MLAVNVDELGPFLHGVKQVVDGLDLQGLEQVAAIHDDIRGIGVIHPHLGVGKPRETAKGGVQRAFARACVGEMVRRAQGLHKSLADVGVEIGALPENHALPAVVLDDPVESVTA